MQFDNSIFASHDFLQDASDSHCHTCGWYGSENELVGPHNIDCPNCDAITFENDAPRVPGEDNLEAFAAEMVTQAIVLNRRIGHVTHPHTYATNNRTHNLIVEIDMHGQLVVRLLNWEKFGSRTVGDGDTWYDIDVQGLELGNPELFDVKVARDLLCKVEQILLDTAEAVPFMVTPAYLAFCAEACIDADNPDNHELYLESIND